MKFAPEYGLQELVSVTRSLFITVLHAEGLTHCHTSIPHHHTCRNFALKKERHFPGPLYVRSSLKDTNTHKVWIVIIICTLSRGVHLEIMEDMSVEQFILALRRFISRRGCPQCIVRDNTKTFKGANKLLQNLFKDEEVKKFLMMKRIEWINILSKAPWYGGVYERLIRSVKRCLEKTLRNAKVTSAELYTLVVEIEGTLNNRPLTYLSADEFGKALTPNHLQLISGRRLEHLPDLKINHCTEEDLSPDNLNRRQEYLGKLLRHWWNRGIHEYLVDLRETHNLSSSHRGEPCIKEGDIVTIHRDKMPRRFWRVGKVGMIIQGKDKNIWGATVKVLSPNGKLTVINRPLSKLYLVEVRDRCPKVVTDINLEKVVESVESKEHGRPKRATALDADAIRRMRDSL